MGLVAPPLLCTRVQRGLREEAQGPSSLPPRGARSRAPHGSWPPAPAPGPELRAAGPRSCGCFTDRETKKPPTSSFSKVTSSASETAQPSPSGPPPAPPTPSHARVWVPPRQPTGPRQPAPNPHTASVLLRDEDQGHCDATSRAHSHPAARAGPSAPWPLAGPVPGQCGALRRSPKTCQWPRSRTLGLAVSGTGTEGAGLPPEAPYPTERPRNSGLRGPGASVPPSRLHPNSQDSEELEIPKALAPGTEQGRGVLPCPRGSPLSP